MTRNQALWAEKQKWFVDIWRDVNQVDHFAVEVGYDEPGSENNRIFHEYRDLKNWADTHDPNQLKEMRQQ